MKNRKGFTLVELLGVITLLGIIALVAIPTMDALLGKNKEKIYQGQLKTIEGSLRAWGDANLKALPDTNGDSITIELGDLKLAGLLDNSFEDTSTETCFQNDLKLTITRVKNNYAYKVGETTRIGSESDCDLPTLEYSVAVKSEPVIEISKNGSYHEVGCVLLKNGMYYRTCTVKDRISNNINAAVAGTYNATYKAYVKDGYGKNGDGFVSNTRTIKVK